MIFVAEVRAANERLYPHRWVKVVISREDAKKIGYCQHGFGRAVLHLERV